MHDCQAFQFALKAGYVTSFWQTSNRNTQQSEVTCRRASPHHWVAELGCRSDFVQKAWVSLFIIAIERVSRIRRKLSAITALDRLPYNGAHVTVGLYLLISARPKKLRGSEVCPTGHAEQLTEPHQAQQCLNQGQRLQSAQFTAEFPVPRTCTQ